MTEIIQLHHKDLVYTNETEAGATSHDATIFGELLGADIGYALSSDGTALEHFNGDQLYEEILQGERPTVAGSFHERYFATDPDDFSDEVQLRSGERRRVDSYDIVLVSQVTFHVSYISYLTERFPELTVIGVQDESVSDILLYSAGMQAHHRSMLHAVDGVIAQGKPYASWVKAVLDENEVLRVPHLVPTDFFETIDTKEPVEGRVCVGYTPFNLDASNFIGSILVVDHLRREGHDVDAEIIGAQEWQRAELAPLEREIDWLQVLPYVQEFYEYLSSYEFVINLTNRVSVSRLSVELAFLGIPCIGSQHNDLQQFCFPDLSIEPYELDRARDLAIRLRSDEGFYHTVTKQAQEAAQELYNHQPYVEQLRVFIQDRAAAMSATDR